MRYKIGPEQEPETSASNPHSKLQLLVGSKSIIRRERERGCVKLAIAHLRPKSNLDWVGNFSRNNSFLVLDFRLCRICPIPTLGRKHFRWSCHFPPQEQTARLGSTVYVTPSGMKTVELKVQIGQSCRIHFPPKG